MDRGNVHYVDIIMAFATLVSFVVVGHIVHSAIGEALGVVDPLSATLLEMSVPVMAIGLILSLGVSAKI